MSEIPRLNGLLEAALYVDNIERSVHFYQTVLGFDIIDQDDRLCALGVAKRQILLVCQKEASKNLPARSHDATGRQHVCFAIPSEAFDEWQVRLQEHAVAVEATQIWSRGGRSLYFRDPDQHLIELASPGVWSIYQTPQTDDLSDEAAVGALYRKLLERWNERDADGMADLFDADGNTVGFDGSQLNGRAEIATEMSQIFASHPTGAYVCKVREIRLLSAEVALLRAVVGMVPSGQVDINPAVNAVQSLVAAKTDGGWRIASFQNTPAQFHGRPEMAQRLTEELRRLL
jgi:uncharacterized protein (TIGR02246 family)